MCRTHKFFRVCAFSFFKARGECKGTFKFTVLHNSFSIFQSTFPQVKKVVDPLQQMRAEIEETRKASLFPMQDGGGARMIDILEELSRRIPANLDVQFSRLIAGTEDSVTITGDTDTFNTVDAMKGSLEGSTIFKEVTIVSTNKESDGNRIRFRLKIKL